MFSWQFPSNVYAGKFREEITVASATQIANNFYRYAEEDATLVSAPLYATDILDTSDVTFDNYLDNADLYPRTSTTYMNKTLIETESNIRYKKDRREELGGTLIFHQKQLSNHVGLGRAFSFRNRLTSENPPTTVNLRYSTTKQFSRLDTLKTPSSYLNNGAISLTTSLVNYNQVIGGISSTWTSWCLSDEDNNILISCNQDGVVLDTITYDFRNKASGIKYKY